MKDKVRIGVIGVGQIGKHHLTNYTGIPGAEVVAAADMNAEELARVATEFRVPQTYTDFRELLGRDDVDAVDVCLHNNLHRPVAEAALRAGKHVFCEKPMAGSYADARAMFETAKACGRMLSIQLATLFSKETKAAKRIIEAGHLGRIYHARSTGHRRRGRPYVDGYGSEAFVRKSVAAGGALYDMGVYHIAEVLYLIGMPAVERVSGRTYQEVEMDAGRCQKSGYDVEELGVGLVRLAGGVTLDIIEAWAIHLNEFEGSSVVGSQGGIRLRPFSFHTNVADVGMDGTFDLEEADVRRHRLDEAEGAYDSPQHHWVAALRGQVKLLPTAEIALETMLVSEGIYLSDALGREVTAAEVAEASKSCAVDLAVPRRRAGGKRK